MEKQKAILLLEDGTTFEGLLVGTPGTTYGEIAFNTGMTGYQEIFTDPSYFGQIVVMANTHIGNYGTHVDDVESDGMKVSGIVVKKFSDYYSRDGETMSLNDYLLRDSKTGISDIDTRALVRIIRDRGAQNCIISSEIFDIEALKAKLAEAPNMKGLELASKVSTKEKYEVNAINKKGIKIALLDYGVKTNIVRCLTERGADVTVFPYDTDAKTITEGNFDGFMLSNGPGDPSAMPAQIEVVKTLVESKTPIFGICLGHQILALSQGLKTIKMHNGHRGVNHPILNLETGKGEITSQNHGFVVDKDSVSDNSNVKMTHRHLNDDTCAGIKLLDRKVFSVQYHPESNPGPHDSRYLFDQFINNIIEHKN